jgi:hypothetical protein
MNNNDVQDKPDFDTKKWIYSFIAKNNKNEEKRFYILKPSRSLRQLGEVEYAKQLASFVKAGLLPKAAWNTILENLGGTISNSEAEDYTKAKRTFFESSIELNKLNQLPELDNKQKLQKAKLELQIEESKREIQTFELEQIYIFENTAEAKARNATIQWWLTQLAYKSEDEQFFNGENYDEMLDWYDQLDPDNEDEAFIIKVGQRFNYLITLWFLNRISNWQDFKDSDSGSNRSADDSTAADTEENKENKIEDTKPSEE